MGPGPCFERLRQDHRRVLAGMAAIETAVADVGPGDRLPSGAEDDLRALLALLEHQFATHMRVEDESVFPALAAALPEARATIAPLAAEHRELRVMLGALLGQLGREGTPARDEQIAVQVRDLADLLRIHIRKEEAVVLRVAERVLTPAEQARLDSAPAGAPAPRITPRDRRDLPRGTHP